MFKKLIFHPLIWIFVLAIYLRTYHLGQIPYGFHIDEVKVGWNAYSLLKTGRDDWWHAFPMHYDSFGDQRPTGIMYTSIPAIAFFGLNEFSTRFTSAIFGALGVIAVYFLTKNLKLKIENFAALVAAVSPWHITLSRATSEGIIASTLILFGLVFLIRKRPNILLSGILLTSSYFFYHSARFLVPAFVITISIFQTFKFKIIDLKLIGLSFALCILSFTFFTSPIARSRLNQISVFKDLSINYELQRLPFEEGQNRVLIARVFHNKIVLYTTRFANEYFGYFSPKFFLSSGESKPARYTTVLRGSMLYIEFILLIIGLGIIAKKINIKSPFLLLLLLLLISPLAAALTTEDSPNLHRALLMSPFLSIIAAIGLFQIKRLNNFVFYFSLLLLLIDFVYFSHQYLVHNAARDDLMITRNGGVQELFTQNLPTLLSSYQHIYFTNRPDPLYTWYAFYYHPSPFSFNQSLAENKNHEFVWGNFTFSQLRCPSELMTNTQDTTALAVNAEECGPYPDTRRVGQITRSSGSPTYSLWTYQPPKID